MLRRFVVCVGLFFLQASLGLAAVPGFPVAKSPIAITAQPRFEQPFDVAGPRGLIVGTQNGVFESWIYPFKLLSDLRVEAELADYPARLDLNRMATSIEVDPGYTVITYSHIAFTVKQIMFVARESRVTVVLFAIDSIRPMKLRVSFNPEMKTMWPAASPGGSPGWDEAHGVAVFNTDQPGLQGVVGIPGAKYEILRPYQERAEASRFTLALDFDPKQDANKFIPLIMTVGEREGDAIAQYSAALNQIPQLFKQNEQYFDHYFDERTVAETPDPRLNLELKWAMLAIEKSRVRFGDEEGLIAGYHFSGNTARPGFGWFFGRDTLWTLFATNGYGDFALTRTALDFLLKRQRNDGKIMHEFSQSADRVKWADLPYFYASADATPLMIIAMNDYLQHSGDTDYIRRNWEKIKLAYQYCRAHDADHDGIYDNAGSGHGWIESGPLSQAFQEIYLAGLWADSLNALSLMAQQLGDGQLATESRGQFEAAKKTINREYWDEKNKRFAFSRKQNGELDTSSTILTSVAMWNRLLDPQKTPSTLDDWASHVFSTDWGTRILASDDKNYDPISYHNGSVWPLFTGWVSVAEYKYGRPLSGYEHMRQNAMLTFAQDPGYVTELLSGDFYEPFPRSSPHQMWSSAMVLTPFFRGTLGMEANATTKSVSFAPQFPAGWGSVRLRNLRVDGESVDVELRRQNGKYTVQQLRGSAGKISVANPETLAAAPQVMVPEASVQPGERTIALKFLDYRARPDGSYALSLEGIGGRSYTFSVCSAGKLSASGATVKATTGCWSDVTVAFSGTDYVRSEVTLRVK